MSQSNKTIPEKMKLKEALARNQDVLARERTELSKVRTELAFKNSRLSVEQTHLAYLRTIVSLIGTAATVFKALPALGISVPFSTGLAIFLMLFAIYFIYKDVKTYPRMKKEMDDLETRTLDLITTAESDTYQLAGEEEQKAE
ncbi:MAG: DUF202 domain-containing protein [Lachnospiraceae bacterium]|nr:DUF202 domain-containing protein [Lachnospiraceae bacterium]